MVNTSRHASPIYVPDDGANVVLERVRLGETLADGERREAFVQNLVHEHPDVIPMSQIEPAFTPLISICRELPTTAGYLDNLWMTPAGGIVLGECKLVRNPQARREVVAQALDYARAINTWSFDDLQAGVRKALGSKDMTLWGMIKDRVRPDEDEADLDEVQFVDAVERRLALGRFLILIIGDGIQEGVEALTSFLQLHAGLHTGIALLDLSIWRGVNGGHIVVPRIPMRTVLVERGIVTVDATGTPRILPSAAQTDAKSAPLGGRPMTSSEPEFYDQLETRRPGLAAPTRAFLQSIAELGVFPEFRKSLLLRCRSGDDVGTLGMIETTGKIWFGNAWTSANKLGHASAGDAYLSEIAQLTGGIVKHYTKSNSSEVGPDGKGIDLAKLLQVHGQWRDIMIRFMAALSPREDQ